MKSLTLFERALIGSGTDGITRALTYFYLLPLDTIKTKLQTCEASKMYKNTFDAICGEC